MQTKQFLAILGSTLLFIGLFPPIRSRWIFSDPSFFEISGGAGAFILLLAIASFILGLAKICIPLLFTGLVSGLTIWITLAPYDDFMWALPVLLLGVGFLIVSGIINLIELNDENEASSTPAPPPQTETPVVEPKVVVEPFTAAPFHSYWGIVGAFFAFFIVTGFFAFLSDHSSKENILNQQGPNSQKEKQEPASEKAKKNQPEPRDTFNQGSSSITNSLGTRSRKEYADYIQRELVTNGYLVSVSVSGYNDSTLEITCSGVQANEIAGSSGMLADWMRLGFRRLVLKDWSGGERTLTLY